MNGQMMRCEAWGECPCSCHAIAPAELLEREGFVTSDLTKTELRVLLALLPEGEIKTAAQIVQRAWGGPLDDAQGVAHITRVNIARMRPKLARLGYAIRNRPGHGYRLERAS